MHITIAGCGDAGTALAHPWRFQTNVEQTLNTTTKERRSPLEALDAQVLVFKSNTAASGMNKASCHSR